ncbi:hypothetical protein, partial [Klebsiella variicola]|uniref:hypothetical protein n=1 Tax=Klebsiella variicola TaxID=244366 RepID=UPI001953295B
RRSHRCAASRDQVLTTSLQSVAAGQSPVARCTNSNIVGLICKMIMPVARHDVAIANPCAIGLLYVQSKRVKPY